MIYVYKTVWHMLTLVVVLGVLCIAEAVAKGNPLRGTGGLIMIALSWFGKFLIKKAVPDEFDKP